MKYEPDHRPEEAFESPKCSNCVHVTEIGGCSLKDGCRHLYKPEVLEPIAIPVMGWRDLEAMEYERFVNSENDIKRINGKFTLTSNQIWEIFNTTSDRANEFAEWALAEIEEDGQEKRSYYQRFPPEGEP